MKRFYIITILAIICSLTAMAQNRPGMAHQTPGRDRDQFMTSLLIPSVSLSDNQLTVTDISGFWTVWITDEFGSICMSPRSFEGENTVDIGFYPSNDVTYVLYISTSAGNTYSWSIERGFVNMIQFGEKPANYMDSSMKMIFPDLLM